MNENEKNPKKILVVLLLLYLALVVFITFFMERGTTSEGLSIAEYAKTHCNLVPFRTIKLYVDSYFKYSYPLWMLMSNTLGNIVLMTPLGILLPTVSKRCQKWWVSFLIFIVFISMIEGLQLVTKRGIFDIDDLLLNVIGAVIGFLFWKILAKKHAIKKRS